MCTVSMVLDGRERWPGVGTTMPMQQIDYKALMGDIHKAAHLLQRLNGVIASPDAADLSHRLHVWHEAMDEELP